MIDMNVVELSRLQFALTALYHFLFVPLTLGLSLLLVYLVLAGQYESWITPAAVIFAVPLALLGTVGAMLGIGFANNIYVQIGLVLLIALSAKNAILIVEMAREHPSYKCMKLVPAGGIEVK